MAIQNFLEWCSEPTPPNWCIDEEGNLIITANTIIVDHIFRHVETFVRKDFGDGYFTDLNHSINLSIQDGGPNRGIHSFWAITNNEASHTHQQMINNGDGIGIYLWYDYVRPKIRIQNYATAEMVESAILSLDTEYFITISRQNDICTVSIYDGGTLFDEISMTVTNQPFRYLFAISSRGSAGSEDDWISTTISNLDIMEEPSSCTNPYGEHGSSTCMGPDRYICNDGLWELDMANAPECITPPPPEIPWIPIVAGVTIATIIGLYLVKRKK